MSITAVILQPGYIPWLGFFDLIAQADIFVFLDDVQFTIRDWRTRNRIRTDRGWCWLSVPVKLEKPYFQYKINEVEISYEHRWIKKHLGTLWAYYRRAKYFNEIYPIIENELTKRYKLLWELDINIIYSICDYLGISRDKFRLASEFSIPQEIKKDERLLAILKLLKPKPDIYLSGNAAKSYLREDIFLREGISVRWHNYKHPYYNQLRWGTNIFISYLSVLDILFNHGKESIDIIRGRINIQPPVDVQIITADDYYKRKEVM